MQKKVKGVKGSSKKYSSKSVETISDSYVIGIIRQGSFRVLKKEDVPKSLIELKRNNIKLKRLMKKAQKDQTI